MVAGAGVDAGFEVSVVLGVVVEGDVDGDAVGEVAVGKIVGRWQERTRLRLHRLRDKRNFIHPRTPRTIYERV